MRRRGMMSPILPTPLPIIQTTTGATQMREPPTIPTRRKYIRPYHPMKTQDSHRLPCMCFRDPNPCSGYSTSTIPTYSALFCLFY
ncbi:hypothetical protein Aduo_018887 [Ancylostoma duodenale]